MEKINFVKNAVQAIRAADKTIDAANTAVWKMLESIKTPEAYKSTRDEFVTAWGAGGADAWERRVLKIGKALEWKKPQSAQAKANMKKRATTKELKTGNPEAKKPSAAKVKGMKAEGKVLTLTMPNKAAVDELQGALSWVMENESHKTLFINWVKMHQGATRQIKAA